MPEPAYAAAAVVIAAVAAFFAGRRKNKAETSEIVDRIAREWITRLEAEVDDLRRQLTASDARHRAEITAWVAHIGVLETHINDRKPPPPPARPSFNQ